MKIATPKGRGCSNLHRVHNCRCDVGGVLHRQHDSWTQKAYETSCCPQALDVRQTWRHICKFNIYVHGVNVILAEGARKCIRDKRSTGNCVHADQDRDENPLQDRSHPTHAERKLHQKDYSRYLGPRTRSKRRPQTRYVMVLAETPVRTRNRLGQH